MSSKYDRVKVKVILDEKHYYILSRFLFSKMLCMCRVPETDAVRVSLGIKKYFVDQEKVDITQTELEEATFNIMSQYGYGASCKRLFPMMTRLYVNRIPLIIFIAGSGYCGKTDIAYTLSLKLSTHVVSTDMLMDIFASVRETFSFMGNENRQNISSSCSTSEERGFWLHESESEEKFIELWRSRAEAVRPLVDAELDKAVSEGKVLIVEGSLLDLFLYRRYLLKDFQKQHGAIVVPFFVTSGDVSRRYKVERFLSTRGHPLPSAIADDTTAAVSWMMRRIWAIEREQMNTLLQDAAVRLCPIDEEHTEDASRTTEWGARKASDACVSGPNCCVSRAEEREGDVETTEKDSKRNKEGDAVAEAEESFCVHVVTYSVAEPTRPHEAMHEVVLLNILSALLQRQVPSQEF